MRKWLSGTLFACLSLAASGARAQVVTPYEWVLQTGADNVIDSNAESCDASPFNPVTGVWSGPGQGCYTRTGLLCSADPSHTCDLQIVPRRRCVSGNLSAAGGPGGTNTCVWPHGAGRCTGNTHVGCLTDAYVENPSVTASGPSTMCPGTGSSTCDMTIDPYGGPFRTDCACGIGVPSSELAVCGNPSPLCSDGEPDRDTGGFGLALGLEVNLSPSMLAFPNLGPSVSGTTSPTSSPRYPIENPPRVVDLQRDPGSISHVPSGPVHAVRATEAVEQTFLNTLLDVRKHKAFGDSFWMDWSFEKSTTAIFFNTHTALVPCTVAPGWAPATFLDPTPSSPNSGDEGYCSQIAKDSIAILWRRDLTPAELAANPSCPPNCKKDFDLTTVESEALLAASLLDRNAGAQLAIQSGEGRFAGAGDVISAMPVTLVQVLISADARCRLGGWGNPAGFIGRCADGPSACIPNDPTLGDALCAAEGTQCRACNGPLSVSNPTGLPIGYNAHGFAELDLVSGQRIGLIAGVNAVLAVPLYLVGTTGFAAAEFRDKPGTVAGTLDLADLGLIDPPSPLTIGIGTGGTFTPGTLPIGEPCCAGGVNVVWAAPQLGTPVTPLLRTFDAGPGVDGIPGCFGDNELLTNGAAACDQRLGKGNFGPKSDGFFATGKDDVAQIFSIGASMTPASQSRYGLRFQPTPTPVPAFNLVSAMAFRDKQEFSPANTDALLKLNVSHCPMVSGVPRCTNFDFPDTDADGVLDSEDNCVFVANPRPLDTNPAFLTQRPWATLTGGQRDDDQDGWGNVCDADFPGTPQGGNVNAADLAQFRASNGHSRDSLNCGTAVNRRCAIYDLDLNQNLAAAPPAGNVNAADLARFRLLNGTPASVPANKCPTCPLGCTSGTSGACP